MADIAKTNPIRITLTVAIDGEQADIDIDPNKSVGHIIKDALLAFDIDEDPDDCHLAAHDRLYFPYNPANAIDLENGAMLSLRLPL